MRKPLMPKATASWLIENTSLSFKQISNFVGLHILEIQAIADGEVSNGILSRNPLENGCLLYTSPSPRDRQKSRMPSSA